MATDESSDDVFDGELNEFADWSTAWDDDGGGKLLDRAGRSKTVLAQEAGPTLPARGQHHSHGGRAHRR